MKKPQWKPLLLSLILTFAVGGLSRFLTRDRTMLFQTLNQPPLSPPGWLFPIVWTILYFLMGISAYLIYISHTESRKTALTLYGVQLAVNFFWPLIFFEQRAYFAAFLWILLLWLLILATLLLFYKISKPAAWMLLPYLLWVTFAAYLNGGIWILNR